MSQALSHVVVTRFNLPSQGAEAFIRAREGWLRNRVELFETYCLPSMLAQTDPDFTWVVYIDPASPPWFVEWMERVAPGAFAVVRRESVGPVDMIDDIAELLGSRPERLLTTNLDNDDAVAVDFVARLRAASLAQSGRTALYLENGLILQGAHLYARRDPSNAFCSVVEPWQGAVTCWTDWHNRLGVHMPVVRLAGAPGWLQVVHGTNVSNRVRGRLVSPRPHAAQFAVAVGDLPDPARGDLVADRLLRSPLRALRDGSRRLVKLFVLRVGGPSSVMRLTDAKANVVNALARRRPRPADRAPIASTEEGVDADRGLRHGARAAALRVLRPSTWKRWARIVNFLGYDGAGLSAASVGPGAKVAPTASVRNGERVRIGAGAQIGASCSLWAGDSAGRIEIGDHALLAPDVFVTASNYDFDAVPGPVMAAPKREADVFIGADTWLGARVVVLPGVSIGDGTVVAAGAVVTTDLPGGVLAAGVPARVIRKRGEPR